MPTSLFKVSGRLREPLPVKAQFFRNCILAADAVGDRRQPAEFVLDEGGDGTYKL